MRRDGGRASGEDQQHVGEVAGEEAVERRGAMHRDGGRRMVRHVGGSMMPAKTERRLAVSGERGGDIDQGGDGSGGDGNSGDSGGNVPRDESTATRRPPPAVMAMVMVCGSQAESLSLANFFLLRVNVHLSHSDA